MAKSRIVGFLIVIILLGTLSYFYPLLQERLGITGKSVVSAQEREEAILVRVIDGDTIEAEVGNETWKIRLLGINTPEKKMPFSDAAASFLKPLINQTVILEKDITDKDMYSRRLRYLFYNDSLMNQQILELGFANSYMLDDLRYKQILINSENQARNLKIGIWTPSNQTCAQEKCIILKELNYTEEFFVIKNICGFKCNLTGWFVKDAGRNIFKLEPINPNEERSYNSSGKEIWNNKGDKFFMFDKSGLLVIFYEYP